MAKYEPFISNFGSYIALGGKHIPKIGKKDEFLKALEQEFIDNDGPALSLKLSSATASNYMEVANECKFIKAIDGLIDYASRSDIDNDLMVASRSLSAKQLAEALSHKIRIFKATHKEVTERNALYTANPQYIVKVTPPTYRNWKEYVAWVAANVAVMGNENEPREILILNTYQNVTEEIFKSAMAKADNFKSPDAVLVKSAFLRIKKLKEFEVTMDGWVKRTRDHFFKMISVLHVEHQVLNNIADMTNIDSQRYRFALDISNKASVCKWLDNVKKMNYLNSDYEDIFQFFHDPNVTEKIYKEALDMTLVEEVMER